MTEKDTIRCESVFNEDRTHRYLWKRVWNKEKPLAAIVMLNPCQADNIITDTTTVLVVNNIARLEEYGGVEVVNLYSGLTSKLNFRWNSDEDLNTPENDHYIRKAADECAVVILAWGKGAGTNKRIASRAEQVVGMLEEHQDKLFQISDGIRSGLHPLTPSIRFLWELEPFHPAAAERQEAGKEQQETAQQEAREDSAEEAATTTAIQEESNIEEEQEKDKEPTKEKNNKETSIQASDEKT